MKRSVLYDFKRYFVTYHCITSHGYLGLKVYVSTAGRKLGFLGRGFDVEERLTTSDIVKAKDNHSLNSCHGRRVELNLEKGLRSISEKV